MKLQDKLYIFVIFLFMLLIPTCVSADNSNSAIFKDNVNDVYYDIDVPEGYCLAYYSVDNVLRIFDPDNKTSGGYNIETDFSYSIGTIENGLFNWTNIPSKINSLVIENIEPISLNCDFYPFYSYNGFHVLVSSLPDTISWNDNIFLYRTKGSLNIYLYKKVSSEGSSSELYMEYNYNFSSNTYTYIGTVETLPDGALFYSHDLYDFFFKTPHQEQETITIVQGVEEIPKVIAEVLKILIPVGLIVLGIGLVILLIKSVIFRHLY